MIDFTISQSDLARTIKILTQARTGASGEFVDLVCSTSSVRFVVTGRESTCPAEVAATGQAQMPIALLPKLGKVAATFKDTNIRLRIENGRVKVNSMSLAMPEITVGPISDRPIGIPDDAPILDILALQYLFTPQEVAASDLANRFLAANSQRLKIMDSAAISLSQLGVSAETIDSIVKAAIQSHAERLRPMLAPNFQSKAIN